MSRGGATGVEQRAPQVGDLDPRLLEPAGRSVLAQVAADHDGPDGARQCPGCGWPLGGGQRVCPSRALARSVRERRPVPAWLVHLAEDVPGAVAPRVVADPAERQAAEDALPGLFEAPQRVEQGEGQR